MQSLPFGTKSKTDPAHNCHSSYLDCVYKCGRREVLSMPVFMKCSNVSNVTMLIASVLPYSFRSMGHVFKIFPPTWLKKQTDQHICDRWWLTWWPLIPSTMCGVDSVHHTLACMLCQFYHPIVWYRHTDRLKLVPDTSIVLLVDCCVTIMLISYLRSQCNRLIY